MMAILYATVYIYIYMLLYVVLHVLYCFCFGIVQGVFSEMNPKV